MSRVLVDTNVLLDVLTEDPVWFEWSARHLDACAKRSELCVNPIVYAEVSIGFQRIEELDEALSPASFVREPVPWEAAFLAGKAFVRYRRARGSRGAPLPDFFIGAHAAVERMSLLTRDAWRYPTYFPTIELICP
jgi:predicted nucleic acid-binding protein